MLFFIASGWECIILNCDDLIIEFINRLTRLGETNPKIAKKLISRKPEAYYFYLVIY